LNIDGEESVICTLQQMVMTRQTPLNNKLKPLLSLIVLYVLFW